MDKQHVSFLSLFQNAPRGTHESHTACRKFLTAAFLTICPFACFWYFLSFLYLAAPRQPQAARWLVRSCVQCSFRSHMFGWDDVAINGECVYILHIHRQTNASQADYVTGGALPSSSKRTWRSDINFS